MGTYIVASLIVISFLLGSIPFGYFIAKKFHGINIQEHGSGNIGSTNIERIIGRKASIITQICDISKGLIPVVLGMVLLRNNVPGLTENIVLFIAAASIIGHDFTPFLNFNGGKGVNTTLGTSIMIVPIPTLVSVIVFYFIKRLGSYVSLASILSGITMPFVAWLLHVDLNVLAYLSFCGILIVVRHKSNIDEIKTRKWHF